MSKRRAITPAKRPPPSVNRLLAALPPADYQRIAPTFEHFPLKLKQFLHKPDERLQHVYFLGNGFCSIVTVLSDGSMVEVATVGREGMVGVSVVLDGQPVPAAAMVQGATDVCYRMPAAAFRLEMDRRGPFYKLMTRYSQAYLGVVMQSTACNAVHSIEQRLARWLLMAQDRMASDEFPLTQEFVAMMLGASRSTVTVVAGTLQKAGLITYHRGLIQVLDRMKLESASCECYRTSTDLLNAVTDGQTDRTR